VWRGDQREGGKGDAMNFWSREAAEGGASHGGERIIGFPSEKRWGVKGGGRAT